MMRHPPHSPPRLTQRQLKRLETLPDDYKVVAATDGIPIVQSPSGQNLCLQPTGRLAATVLIERVVAYRHLQQG